MPLQGPQPWGGICRCRGGNACLALRCFQGGVFTNEAGLGGSASIAHAAAVTDHPARQGLWGGIIEVVIDTHIICTFTALALLITGGAWTSGLEGAS